MDDLARSFVHSQALAQLALSIVTEVDAGRMRLNARKHGTRIISDRKAETRLAWRTRLRRRVIALCVTTCVTTGRSMCVCGKVISRRDCLPGCFVRVDSEKRCRGEETSSEVKSVLEQDERRHVAGKGN